MERILEYAVPVFDKAVELIGINAVPILIGLGIVACILALHPGDKKPVKVRGMTKIKRREYADSVFADIVEQGLADAVDRKLLTGQESLRYKKMCGRMGITDLVPTDYKCLIPNPEWLKLRIHSKIMDGVVPDLVKSNPPDTPRGDILNQAKNQIKGKIAKNKEMREKTQTFFRRTTA